MLIQTYAYSAINHVVTFEALTGPDREIQILSIDAGAFSEDGKWVQSYRRNGDERSVRIDDDHPILRVKILHP